MASLQNAIDKLERLADPSFREAIALRMSKEATAMYRRAYAEKRNPYGEAWEPRPGDNKARDRGIPYGGLGEISRTSEQGFSIVVYKANPKRSCVPVQARGLGSWFAPLTSVFVTAVNGVMGK